MNRSVLSGQRSGTVSIPSSKSMAHRYLIAAALSGKKCSLRINGFSEDIMATVNCLGSLGSVILKQEDNLIVVTPAETETTETCILNCNESGSTLRFLIPTVGALGRTAVFHMADGLARRPVDELISVMEEHGVSIKKSKNELALEGKLSSGEYNIPGNISSQYISGLLFALPLLEGDSVLRITGGTESKDYILMTEKVILQSGIVFEKEDSSYRIPGGQKYGLPDEMTAEPDWSNAAFFLCAGALSEKGARVTGLNTDSPQGDREILNILRNFGAEVSAEDNSVTVKRGNLKGQTIDASAVPDLVPVISVVAANSKGTTRITNAARLRYKETDRLRTTYEMLTALGADIGELQDGLVINGKPYLEGGTVNAANDHRIAMSAAVAASVCINDITVEDSECVKKSYPDFWKDFESLEVIK